MSKVEAGLRELFDELPVVIGVYHARAGGGVARVESNAAFERWVPKGSAVDDAIERLAERVIHEGTRETFDSVGPAGPLGLHVTLTPMRREGEPTRVAVTGVETSASVTRGARFADAMLGMLGHDLRNPLSAIATAAALLRRRGGLTTRQEDVMRRMEGSVARMATMISHIVELARGTLGQPIPITREEVDLGAVVRAIAAELQAAHLSNVLDLDVEGDGRTTGRWDAQLVEDLVTSVLSNALQHGAATATIHVRVRALGADVEIVISNQGAPIPAEILPLVFEPFALRARAKKPGFLGVGLYASSRIVEAHGGSLALSSSAAEGTCVRIVLPRDGA